MFALNISTQHCARGISREVKTRKLMKGIKMGKAEAKLSLFTDDLSSLGRKFLESTKNYQNGQTSQARFQDTRTTQKIQLCFYAVAMKNPKIQLIISLIIIHKIVKDKINNS